MLAIPSIIELRPETEMVPAALNPSSGDTPLLLHKVAAGFPSPAADYVEKSLDLNAYLVAHREASFFFRVSGDSVSGAGIIDGDVVLIDRSINPCHGQFVLAVIDGEYTLKRLHHLHGVIELHPENPAFTPIRLSEGQELQIWGVVAAVIRKYRV